MLLRFSAVALLVLLISASLDVKANPQTTYGYTCVSYIPAEWGEFKGSNQQSGLALQAWSGWTTSPRASCRCASPRPALEIRRNAPKAN